MQESAGPRKICIFSQQPSMKQNSLSSFLKGKLKVNFLKTRRRPLGSSQLVFCSHWRRAESRRNTAKSMLLILTLSSSHKALQDGRPPHVAIILQPILDVLLPHPDHRLLQHLKRFLHHHLHANLSFMSTTQHKLGYPGIALSLSNKFCWVFTSRNKLTNLSGFDICHTGCWIPRTLSENLPSTSIEPSFEK